MAQDHEEHYRPAPHADEELVPFDVQGYSGNKGIWLLGLMVLTLLAVLFFLFKIYQPGVRDRGEAPKILADKTPYKVEPDNPGGDVVPNQDLEVYDVMNGTTTDATVKIADSAEEPMERPLVDIEIKDRGDSGDSETPSETISETIPKPEPVIVPPTSSSGLDSRYVVQLASLRSQSDADNTWTQIQKKYSGVIPNGGYADIIRASVPEKGIFYRVRLAGMPDQATAKRVCDKFQSLGQSCFVTTK